MRGRQIPRTIKYLVRASERAGEKSNTVYRPRSCPWGKTKYRFEAVVARLPALGMDPRRSEGGGFSVSQGAQVATGPSSGFCVQSKETLIPTFHWEPSP